MFPSNNGKPRYSGSLRREMNRVAEALGIDIRVGPQVLRRTFNSLLLDAGVSELVVRSIVGHSSQEMSELYSHFDATQKANAARRGLGELFG